MIGEGVLLECLNQPQVTEVLSVSRKPTGLSHPKLKEYLVGDFLSINENDPTLKGYDACFYCAGVSSVGMDEATYRRIHLKSSVGPQKYIIHGTEKSD